MGEFGYVGRVLGSIYGGFRLVLFFVVCFG